MKQCPKCNKTYANDKQKFCTKDGSALVDALEPRQDATIRMDSAELDDEITKVISQPLPRMTGSAFDPYKTQVSKDNAETAPSQPSEPLPPPPVAPPAPPRLAETISAPAAAMPEPPQPSQPIAPPPLAPPAPPRLADTISAPASATDEPSEPTRRIAPRPVAPPTPPAVAASATANIAQSTNASIPADTRPAMAIPPVPPAAPAPPAFQPPVAQPKKRSKIPLILGILFFLLLIGAGGVVAGYFFVLKPMLDKKRVIALEPRRPEPTPMVVSTPDIGNTKPEEPKVDVPPYSPPADAVQFVNSNAKLSGKLAEHFVEFSFYYPKSWHKDPDAGTATSTNFAKMQRQLAADAPQEIFAVGWYDSTGARETDEASYARLVADRSAQFAKAYPEYRKLSEGPTKAGPYDAYEFRFSGAYRNTTRGDIIIWGRVIFVPPVEGKRGVTLLMLASSLASEVKGVDDVGVKGELPMVLESFRFAK